MRNDKEFKAKNRDESYVKDKRPDIQLGRHTEGEKQKPPITQSKKNRMYRARQAENTAANSENVSVEIKTLLLKQRLIFPFLKRRIIMLPFRQTAQHNSATRILSRPKRKIYRRTFSRIFRKPSCPIPLPQRKRNTAVKCTVCKSRQKALITILQGIRKNQTTTIFPKRHRKTKRNFQKIRIWIFRKAKPKGTVILHLTA